MITFSKEHKEEMGKYFSQGIHEVTIGEITSDKVNDKTSFRIIVLGDDGQEGEVRLWFHSDGAIKYSFSTLRSIFVHNATTEEKKNKIRDQINAIDNDEQLLKICQQLVGKKCWYSVFENPERQYTTATGETKNSFDKNIYGYEPKPPKHVTGAEPKMAEGEITDDGKIVGF